MKKKVFYAILEVFYRVGILRFAFFVQNALRASLMVLMFHRVSDGKNVGLPSISIRKENYIKLVNLLQQFFNIVSHDELLQMQTQGENFPARATMITFDDAYEEAYQNGAPELIGRSIPATVFAVTDAIDKQAVFWWDVVYAFLQYANLATPIESKFYEILPENLKVEFNAILNTPFMERGVRINTFIERLKKISGGAINEIKEYLLLSYNTSLSKEKGPIARSMNLESLLELKKNGYTVGSHTVTHQFLNEIPESDIRMELRRSKQKLEKAIGTSIDTFAYPAGIYNSDVVRMVKESGYLTAFTTQMGCNSKNVNLLEIKRINIWDDFVCDNRGKFSASLTLWRLMTATGKRFHARA